MSESANGHAQPRKAALQAAAREREKVTSARAVQQRAQEADHAQERLADLLGSRYSPKRVRLEDYRVYAGPKQAFALRAARAVAARIGEFVEAGRSLVFYGTHGTGKDFLLAADLYAACRAGYSVSWSNGQDIFGRLADAVRAREPKEAVLRPLALPRVLGLSDPIPSAGSPDDYSLTDLYRLIDRRDRDGKVTWLSVNADSPAAAERALSGAVWSRLSQGAVMVPCFWQDYRKRKFGEAIPCTPTDSTATAPTTAASAQASTNPPPPR